MATPSQRDGVSTSDEKRHRFFACELIQEGGILLQLPQVVLATAQSILHRFYTTQSLFEFDAFRVAMGCIFLAAKAEEQPRRIKDVVQVFFRMRNRRMGLGLPLLTPSDARFSQWSDWVILVERQLLIEVGFSIDGTMEHPHKFLLYYVKMLDVSNACAQKAWNYVNDSYRVDLCLRYDAHVIACAAISLSARVLQQALPLRWEELLEVDVVDVVAVAQEMLVLYTIERLRWLKPLTEVDPFAVTAEDSVMGESAATEVGQDYQSSTPPPVHVASSNNEAVAGPSPSPPLSTRDAASRDDTPLADDEAGAPTEVVGTGVQAATDIETEAAIEAEGEVARDDPVTVINALRTD
ncbi:Aste57867_25326 [Aphanomyces stellatus]|uniref:Aste57867_25326 protein n=1 Tax=Aphanomyces stellatus TaxID=120398 RepID=A0A485LSY4_9STRA|nr:hypothetical protein As57867_025248 [Aphanomyces stellatus]VFU01951.1 Aste57867_25326 [Aphanomyces stellatus]